ncbi:MAG: SusC/RagA family TonB-linked outer membrane protein, partial [Muribaculaceae bacterium]|nr:SusC/RagA family TonB-linked outer membrane protein [Muribaculaceae bacterium]
MTETRFLSFGRLQYVFSRKVTRVLTVTALALAFNGVSAYAEPVAQAVQRQGKKVTGTVFDRTDNEPIVGATVQVVGTNIGTSTDIDGKFIISNLPAGAKKIRISFVGMKSQELDIKSEMTVYLDQDAQDMEEVLVVAYGTAKKGTFTGAASSVNSTQLSNKVMTTATSALVGSVPGLTVTTANGQPGSAPSIYIRGMGSMSASNDPLIVLDGMPYDNSISSINPSDIDNITILKDASSTALYGARAANGVLMITTKKGNKDKLRVNVSLNQGFTARQTGDYEKVNLNDYVKVYWENLRNQYVRDGSSYEDAGMAASKNLFDNLAYNPFNMPGEQALDANGNLNPMARLLWEDDTDWEDAVQQLGNRTDATVSISGGTDRADFFASVGYTDEKGYIIGSRFKRYTARSNMNAQITKWLKVGTNLSGNISLSDGNQNESSGNNSNPFRFVRNIGPIYPIHVHNPETGEYILDEAGNKIYDFGTAYSGNGIEVPARDFVSGNNPVKELQDRQDSFKRNTLNAKVYAEIKFLKGF